MIVYLAGPMTATDKRTVADNVANALLFYHQLIRAGVCAFCPQLDALAPGAFDIPYERWMEHDFAVIERCDVVLMLPNWETSGGAKREHVYALKQCKRIVYDVKELLT